MAVRGTTKFRSNLQEKRVAKEMSARVVIGSGSLWGSKGDVRDDLYLIECKTTENHHYSLTTTVWDKIEKEAIRDGLRIAVMSIDLNNGVTRLAVLKKTSVDLSHLNLTEEVIKPGAKSFRVKSSIGNSLVKMTVKGKPLELAVIYWDDFLEAVEKEESYYER